MADQKALEDIAKKEYEKTSATAKVQAKTSGFLDTVLYPFKLIGKTVKLALGAAALGTSLYLGYSLIGIDAVATGLGFIIGDWLAKKKNKEPITWKDTVVRGIGGTLMGGFLHYAFPAAHFLGDTAGAYVSSATGSAAYGTATQIATKSAFFLGPVFPAFIYADNLTHSMLDWSYKRPKGKEFWKHNWDAVKVLGIPVCLNANFTKQYLGAQFEVPIGAALSALYSFVTAKPKEKKAPATAPAGYGPQAAYRPA